MNKRPVAAALVLSGAIITGCGSSLLQRASEPAKPTFIIQAREPIAIISFETENALSNLEHSSITNSVHAATWAAGPMPQ